METIIGKKVPPTYAVTDLDDVFAKDIGDTDHSRDSIDLSVPEERNRLLSIRADINKQLKDTQYRLKEEREKLNDWNIKVSEFKMTMPVFTFDKYRYMSTAGYPFVSPAEKQLLFGVLCSAEEWGNKVLRSKRKELCQLEKQRDLHYENVMVLKGNLELLKSSSYKLSLKIKDSRNAGKSLNETPNGISEHSTTSVE